MSPTKVLNINPDFFSLKQNNNSKTLKKEKKKKPTEVKSDNSIRKALLAKIKDYQKKGEEDRKKEKLKMLNEKNKEEEFESEFNKSLNFLQELSNKHKNKHNDKHNKTLKKQKLKPIEPMINVELPEALIETPNSITNNSQDDNSIYTKPLIKNPNDTIIEQQQPLQQFIAPIEIQTQIPIQTNAIPILPGSTHIETNDSSLEPINIQDDIIPNKENIIITNENIKIDQNSNNSNSNIDIRKHKKSKDFLNNTKITLKNPPPYSNLKGGNKPTFKEWNKTHKYNSIGNVHHGSSGKVVINEQSLKKRITKKYKTIKYNLGKKGRNIHVLIKNNNTRKKVKHELSTLKKKPILEVKDYLHQKNLIKTGSLAPNDVLREIYEQSILSGDIINESKDNLIHNFFNNKNAV